MDPSYSVAADMLAKFHTSSEWIKTLWLVAVPATVVGVSWCVSQVLREAIRALACPRPAAPPVPEPAGFAGLAGVPQLAGREGEVWLRLPAPAEPWGRPSGAQDEGERM
jgi:hypothetical protein